MSSDPHYTNTVSEDSVTQAIRSQGELGLSGGAIYCHNHHCSKTDYELSIRSDTVYSMLERSPHPIPQETLDDIKELDQVDVGLHRIDDGDLGYVLIGPDLETDEIEVSGWYCSAACIENNVWPSEDHIAIEVELHCDNPPDIRRTNVVPIVKEIEGIHLIECPQRRVSEFG